MKKIVLFCCLCLGALSFPQNMQAQAIQAEFKKFVEINNALVNIPIAAQQEVLLFENEALRTRTPAKSFYFEDAHLVVFDNMSFLSTVQGYWIMNNKLKSPLKVSGNYKAEQIEIQDILRIDFEHDYKKLEQPESDTLFLERTNTKMPYPYLRFESLGASAYRIHFMDRNKQPVRTIKYSGKKINGYFCFAELEIRDLIFSKQKYFKYITHSLQKVSLPKALFSPAQMKNLLVYVRRYR